METVWSWLGLNKVEEFVQDQFHSLFKLCLHSITGHSEIARICDEGRHNASMSSSFSKSVKRSKQLITYSTIIFQYKPFSVYTVKTNILQIKHLHREKSKLILPNVTNCLQSLRLVTMTYQSLESLQHQSFSYADSRHVSYLESLWKALKPNQPRSSERISSEWQQLGFQGKDPSTDFRGMGFLSVVQLLHFAQSLPNESRAILQESLAEEYGQEHLYYSFAATGINITAMIMEFFAQHRFHSLLYANEDWILLKDQAKSPEGASDDEQCLQDCMHLVHDVYNEVFMKFHRYWHEDCQPRPKNIMEFPKRFAEVKAFFQEKYPPL